MRLHYFQINLNKRDERTKIQERKRRTYIINVLLIIVVIIAIFGYHVYQTYLLDKMIEQRKKTISQLTDQIAALEQQADFVGKDDVLALQELVDERIMWSKKFATLSEITPENMTITNVFYYNKRLRIEGLSKIIPGEREFDRVVNFMDRIKSNPEFNNDIVEVMFEESNRTQVRQQNLLSFAIACRFK